MIAIYALPVVDATAKPVALVDRKRFIEFFSKPYSKEIFGRRGILDLLAYKEYENTKPVIVEDNCSVEDVSQIIIDAGMQHMVTGFVVSSQGRYLGVANGHDLLNIITQRKQAELYYLAHYDSIGDLKKLRYSVMICHKLATIMSISTSEGDILAIKQVADYLKVTDRTIYNLAAAKNIWVCVVEFPVLQGAVFYFALPV